MQPPKPKISIIVPVYNVKPFLTQCIDSILAQTFEDLEILLIDDGSTDGSGEICDGYAQKEGRIRALHKENRGYGHTINVGMAMAKGEYVGIVESDDYIAETMYQVLYNKVEGMKLDFVKGNYCSFYQQADGTPYFMHKGSPNGYYNHDTLIQGVDDTKGLLYSGANWTGLYRRSFLEEHGIFHNESGGASYQDTGFALLTFLYSKRMMFLTEEFYYYRIDNASSSIHQKNKMECIIEEMRFVEGGYPSLFSTYQELILGYYLDCVSFDLLRLDDTTISLYLAGVKAYLLEEQEKGYFTGGKLKPSHLRLFQDILTGKAEGKILTKKQGREEEKRLISSYAQVILYGAGYYGWKTRERLRVLTLEHKISCYGVTQLGEETQLDGIPILPFSQLKPDSNTLVIICGKEGSEGAAAMTQTALEAGFPNVLPCQGIFEQYRDGNEFYL